MNCQSYVVIGVIIVVIIGVCEHVNDCHLSHTDLIFYMHIPWFPHGLEKWENFFQSGNFEQTGKVGEFYPKYWKSEGILAIFYFIFFSLTF